eukprot:scaffold21777_cov61-Phaeocystis_antarctica.AAC.3
MSPVHSSITPLNSSTDSVPFLLVSIFSNSSLRAASCSAAIALQSAGVEGTFGAASLAVDPPQPMAVERLSLRARSKLAQRRTTSSNVARAARNADAIPSDPAAHRVSLPRANKGARCRRACFARCSRARNADPVPPPLAPRTG